MVPFRFRPFAAEDLEACLRVFDGNLPDFFAPDERDGLRAHLMQVDGRARHYLVIEAQGHIRACGGVTVEGDAARLTWGMVARDWQGRGLGARLLAERMALLARHPAVRRVGLSTGPRTVGFYARFGFRVLRVVPDGFAPGLDCCEMEVAMRGGAA